jgi:hypothetical protein
MSENKWVEVKGKLSVRKGTRGEWMEMKIEGKRGGEEVIVKMIGRKVKEFWSERLEGEGFVMDE